MRLAAFALASMLALGATIVPPADDPTSPAPGAQYRALLDEFEAARRTFAGKLEAAATDEQSAEIRAKLPIPEDYYERLLSLAEAHPEDDAAVDALAWIVATSSYGYDEFKERGARIRRAMDRLAGDHLNDPRVGRACLELARSAAPLRDGFLHDVYAGSTDRHVKGRACLALGQFLLSKAETVALLKGPSGGPLMRRVAEEAPHRLPYLEQLVREEPETLARQGEQLLERAIVEYGDLPYDPILRPREGRTLGEVARTDLLRLRSLAVGQEAPEIDGRDVDGNRFRLSDYRGRVVLLSFSGNWCGPCRAAYPDERALVERLGGRPFALLGVNTDEKPETLRRSIDEGEITWRCWWESGTEGPICSRWMIEGFPQAYLLDHEGVIRYHGPPDGEVLSRQVADLIRACEAAGRSPK